MLRVKTLNSVILGNMQATDIELFEVELLVQSIVCNLEILEDNDNIWIVGSCAFFPDSTPLIGERAMEEHQIRGFQKQ